MATIKQWLDEKGFDWANGRIVYQEVKQGHSLEWGMPKAGRLIDADDPILIQQFDSGYGWPECPRFVAEDARGMYFPGQYDGATLVVMVHKDITVYLDKDMPTPYPGG